MKIPSPRAIKLAKTETTMTQVSVFFNLKWPRNCSVEPTATLIFTVFHCCISCINWNRIEYPALKVKMKQRFSKKLYLTAVLLTTLKKLFLLSEAKTLSTQGAEIFRWSIDTWNFFVDFISDNLFLPRCSCREHHLTWWLQHGSSSSWGCSYRCYLKDLRS